MTRMLSATDVVSASPAVPPGAATGSRRAAFGPIPREIVNILVVSLGLLLALQAGSMIADSIQAVTPWLDMVCFVVPVAAMAGFMWLIGRLF
jgi:hypothetical protein